MTCGNPCLGANMNVENGITFDIDTSTLFQTHVRCMAIAKALE